MTTNTTELNEMIAESRTMALRRWLKTRGDKHGEKEAFEAGWRECLGTLPATPNSDLHGSAVALRCNCLTCRVVSARQAEALG